MWQLNEVVSDTVDTIMEKRNFLLPAFSSFPKLEAKAFSLWIFKSWDCVVKAKVVKMKEIKQLKGLKSRCFDQN